MKTRRSSAKLNPRPLERWVRLVGMEIIAGSSRLLLFAFVIHSAQCAASRLLRPCIIDSVMYLRSEVFVTILPQDSTLGGHPK